MFVNVLSVRACCAHTCDPCRVQGGYGIDARDADTPDNWVPRHPDLIRLTGRHPFNVEPPLTMLMDAGLITPPAIHIVRDHGAVPKLDWDTHTIEIGGAVSNPLTITMDELSKMETISFPCTVTCAGNRRKEQNMTKQTVGFNWGAAATGCSVWTGVPLRNLLLKAGVKDKENGARFVCMEGADKLPNGYYGTCLGIDQAMDPTMDVIVAFEQNGQRLIPDHGYPVRMIIPGWIGGRMVKWMTKITITEKESDNYYHFFDNRILPPQVRRLHHLCPHAVLPMYVRSSARHWVGGQSERALISSHRRMVFNPDGRLLAGGQGDCGQGRLVVQARVSLQRAQHQLGDRQPRPRRGGQVFGQKVVHDARLGLLGWRQKGDQGGGVVRSRQNLGAL